MHSACGQHNSNFKTVRLLFDSYPEAIFINDGEGETPLDNAQRCGHVDVATFLETQHAFATIAQDATAMATPNHNVSDNASFGSIKLLVKGNLSAVRVASNRFYLYFHVTCAFSATGVVELLPNLNESCLDNCDMNNGLPLYHACRTGNCGAVKYLLTRCVQAFSELNGDNKLPIHLLCECERFE